MWLECIRPLNSIPVFAGEGTVIPLSRDSGNSAENPAHLEAEIYNGSSEYSLYEDDEYMNAALTTFVTDYEDGRQTVKLSFRGDTTVLPENRDMTLTFKNIVMNTPVDGNIGAGQRGRAVVTVLKNGKPTDFSADTYETVSVTVRNIDYSAEYSVTVEYKPLSELALMKRSALLKLQRTEAPLSVRKQVSDGIKKAASPEQLRCTLLISDLDPIDRERLCENIY